MLSIKFWHPEIKLIIITLITCVFCINIYADTSLAGQWRFDETTGTTASDSSGNGNDGTLVNMSTSPWITGSTNPYEYFSNSLNFGETNDYVVISNESSLQLNDNLTISLWIKPSTVGITRYSLVDKDYGGEFSLTLETNGSVCLYQGRAKSGGWFGATVIPASGIIANEWQHIVVTRNISTREIKGYINGNLENTVIYPDNSIYFPPIATTSSIIIGDGYLSNYNGQIDKVQIYSRDISADEVKKQYAKKHLRMDLQMNDGSGTTATDSSDCSNDVSLVNMLTSSWVTGNIDSDGYFRNAISFDGVNDYLVVSNNNSLQLNGDITISLWIKPSTLGTLRRSLVDKDYGGEFSLTLETNGSINLYQGRTKSGGWFGAVVIPADSIITDEWQHIVVTRNISTREIKGYLDGSLETTVTYPDKSHYFPPVATTNPVIIGDGYLHCYNGELDKVQIYNNAISADEVLDMHFNLLDTYSKLNYYTSENTADVVFHLGMLASELEDCTLTARDNQDNLLGTNTSPGNSDELSINISGIQNGTNSILVELRRDTGELVFDNEFDLIKKASNSGNEVKVNQKDNYILNDGIGFFPIGVYALNIAADDTDAFAEISNAGFNTIIHYKNSGVTPSDSTTYLENAWGDEVNGPHLMVVEWQEAYTTAKLTPFKLTTADDFWDAYKGLLDFPYDVDQSARMIQAVGYAKQETNLLAYYSFDEPYATEIAAGQDLYSRTNTEDGYHPTFALYPSIIPEGDDYTNWCDSLGVDTYWIPPKVSGDLHSSVDFVTKYTFLAKERAQKTYKAFFSTLMGERCASYKRTISSNEQRCQTYLALINGVKGLFYFRYPLFHEDIWNTIVDLNSETADLSQALLLPELEQDISYSQGLFDPANDTFVDVQVHLLKAPVGESYDYILLAVNTKEYSVSIDCTISLLGSSGTINRMFNTATYSVSNGEFSDTLAAYATRAYTFNSTSSNPVTIQVDTIAGSPPSAETLYPKTGRANMTNILPNPSFEDSYVTNWPDYYIPYDAVPRINATNQGWGMETIPSLSELNIAITNDGGNPNGSSNPGSKCLKIIKNEGVYYNGFTFLLSPQHADTSGKDYTFSVYLKADQAGDRVVIGSTSGYTSLIPLTTTWTRYEYTVNIPANLPDINENHLFYVRTYDNGSIWADAAQVEQASSASAFTNN